MILEEYSQRGRVSRAGNEKRRENAEVGKTEKTWTEKSKKWLTNGGGGCIIFLVSSASVLRAKPNIGDLHSGSAVDSDSTCGSSILSSPTRKPQSQLAAVFSGHSAVGSAPRSGRGGRGFKSRCSDQKRDILRCVSFFFLQNFFLTHFPFGNTLIVQASPARVGNSEKTRDITR